MFAGVAVALTTLSTCVIGEVVLRLKSPQTSFYLPDDHCGYRLEPNYAKGELRINRWGMRDADPGEPGSKTGRRVLVVGDSFCFAMGVKEVEGFPHLLEQRLGPQVTVINGGVPGYSHVNMAGWLEHYGVQWQPDAVVLAVFTGNDLWENLGSDGYHVTTKGELLPKEQRRQRTKRGFWRQLRNKSHFYRLLKSLPERVWQRVDQGEAVETFWTHTRERMGVCVTGEAATTWEPAWEVARAKLKEMVERVKPAPVVLLVISDEFQLSPAVREEVKRRYPEVDLSRYDWTLPNRRFAQLAAELGIRVVDPYEDMKRLSAAGKRQYLPPLEAHYNAAGHALVAEQLAATKELAGLMGE